MIVNLQSTPYDDAACLIIRERVDRVMQDIMKGLGYDDIQNDDVNQHAPNIERVWNMDSSVLSGNGD